MIIDAKGLVLGRLSTFVAKKLLIGEEITIVNSEKAVIIGSKEDILAKYKQRVARGGPLYGPFFPKAPERIVKRTIRGMLPYNIARGREALANVKCYKGIPQRFSNQELMTVERAKKSEDTRKFMTLERLSSLL